MSVLNTFRLESGPFIMEVTGTDKGWIARVDGAGEHYKQVFPDETAAKHGCLEAAQEIFTRKQMVEPHLRPNPIWN